MHWTPTCLTNRPSRNSCGDRRPVTLDRVDGQGRVKLDLYEDTAEALRAALHELRRHQQTGAPIQSPRPDHARGLDLLIQHLDGQLSPPPFRNVA